MKFIPRLPKDDVNVSKKNPVKEAVYLVAGVFAAALVILTIAAFFIENLIVYLPASAEVFVFQKVFPSCEEGGGGHADKLEQMRAMLARLTGQWPENPYDFRLGVVEDKDVNAMAVPGGVILFTSAALECGFSDQEIMWIMAHELGHFHHRDHLRRFGRSALLTFVSLAIDSSASSSTGDLIDFAAELAAKKLDRSHEKAADLFAAKMTMRLDLECLTSVGVMQRFQALDNARASKFFKYLSTHPYPDERIAYLEAFCREQTPAR
ncbi:MAG: hypothetical protein C4523_16000 [Myxococcales bacterium]|nr:MAG: hypothetical protein C4523_16000 [Myxococcales bacterium]